MHQHPMVPDHGTQYEEKPSSHHGGMPEDKQMDGLTDRQDLFLYTLILPMWSGEY